MSDEATPVAEVAPPRHISDVITDLEKAKADLKTVIEQSNAYQTTVKDAHALVAKLTTEYHAAAQVFETTITDVVTGAEGVFDWLKAHL